MAQPACSEKEFIELFKLHRSPKIVAEILKISERSVHSRKKRLEQVFGMTLESNDNRGRPKFTIPENKVRCEYELKDGIILVGSDCHYNPNYITTAHRAFVYFTKQLKPSMIVLNGDLFDFAQISAHHRIGFQQHPTVQQELEEVNW